MTGPRLTVVEGGGQPEPDAEAVAHAEEAAAAMIEAAKQGHGFWLLIDSDEPLATYGGDGLVLAATAEEAARSMKRELLGFE